jgi:transposase InsO family protein
MLRQRKTAAVLRLLRGEDLETVARSLGVTVATLTRWRDAFLSAGEAALARFGRPEIFNTDQGSQFTSPRFTEVLTDAGVRISMDGRGRWMDNVFIERLWRSLKYECVYLHAFETGSELRAGLLAWIGYYNTRRPHSSLGGLTPDEAYAATGVGGKETEQRAA